MIKKNFLTNFLLIFFSLLLILIFLEIFLRSYINYNPSYYSAFKKNYKYISYPYGIIPVNSLGYFDDEFKKNNKKTIGYVGDSVLYGVGAGYPYRVTDILKKKGGDFNIYNLGTLPGQDVLNKNFVKKIFSLKEEFNLSRLIYLMNLNDLSDIIYNEQGSLNKKQKKNVNFLKILNSKFAFLDNSYLYNFIKFKIKNKLLQRGFDYHGYTALELHPSQNLELIKKVTNKINLVANSLKENDIKFCLAILPYEMQISKDAAEFYKKIGIRFSDDFIDFKTQKIILENIDKSVIDTIILGETFDRTLKIGEYFVFNKGDKIDFNHLNRKGHLKISEEIFNKRFCY